MLPSEQARRAQENDLNQTMVVSVISRAKSYVRIAP